MSAKCAWVSPNLFEKIEWGKGQTGEKNCSSTFVLTAFNFLGRFNIFPLVGDGSLWPRCCSFSQFSSSAALDCSSGSSSSLENWFFIMF